MSAPDDTVHITAGPVYLDLRGGPVFFAAGTLGSQIFCSKQIPSLLLQPASRSSTITPSQKRELLLGFSCCGDSLPITCFLFPWAIYSLCSYRQQAGLGHSKEAHIPLRDSQTSFNLPKQGLFLGNVKGRGLQTYISFLATHQAEQGVHSRPAAPGPHACWPLLSDRSAHQVTRPSLSGAPCSLYFPLPSSRQEPKSGGAPGQPASEIYET